MIDIRAGVSLAPLTWWKIGGTADHFAEPSTIADLAEAMRIANQKQWPITVLGGGSNILVSDKGIAGLTLSLRNLCSIETVREIDGRLEIVALAGANKAEITKIFLQRKLAPALFLCGLPGEVGGGVVMNAGVGEMITPREFVEIVEWIEVLKPTENGDIEKRSFSGRELHWSYRHCEGWQPGVIARVALSWSLDPRQDVMEKVRLATKMRREKQPLEWPSCGSVFRNPPGGKAGALIEQSGLKGFSIGAAQISEKHANFIINRGGARAQDVMNLINHIQGVVRDKHGVELTPEVKFLGRWELLPASNASLA
jgi:UDP-N-acetylmuramate dehydrogenase